MDTIITRILELVKISDNPIGLENALDFLFQDWNEWSMAYALERLDKALYYEYKQEGWRVDRIEERTIQFRFGKVHFRRRRLKRKGEKSFLALDKALGLEKRKRYSPNVKAKMAEMGAKMPFRQAEAAVHKLTPLTISHSTIHAMTQEVGEHVQDYLNNRQPEPMKKRKTVPVLFIEGDGLRVKGRNGDRPEIHRVVIHEGVKQHKKRTSLINPMCFSSVESSTHAFEQAAQYLNETYQLKETIVVSNSDGGSGYEASKFEMIIGYCKRHEHFRDRYHVNRKITDRLSFDKKMERLMFQAVLNYDWERVNLVLMTAESRLDGLPKELVTDRQYRIDKLKNYLERNWPHMKPFPDRNLPVEKGIGVGETGHRFFSYRTKHQGRAWSKPGVGRVTAILSAMKNNELEEALTTKIDEQISPLGEDIKGAVRQALKKVKTGTHRIQTGKIPNNGSTSSPMGRLVQALNL